MESDRATQQVDKDNATHEPSDATILLELEDTMSEADWQVHGITDLEPFRMLSPV